MVENIYRYRFATEGKLTLFKPILLSSILLKNRVIVIEIKQKIFQLQLQLLTFENFQLQLQQNRAFNYNFVNYIDNFSKPCSSYTDEELKTNFHSDTVYVLGR